jgi:hypothetical protein
MRERASKNVAQTEVAESGRGEAIRPVIKVEGGVDFVTIMPLEVTSYIIFHTELEIKLTFP